MWVTSLRISKLESAEGRTQAKPGGLLPTAHGGGGAASASSDFAALLVNSPSLFLLLVYPHPGDPSRVQAVWL